MELTKVIQDLRREQQNIDEAITVLERLAAGGGRRRGRPPAWLKQAEGKRRRGRPVGSKNRQRESAEA